MTVRFNIHGELGNQMFQWATGISYSRSTSKTVKFKTLPGFANRLNEFASINSYAHFGDITVKLGNFPKLKSRFFSYLRHLPNPFYFDEKHLNYQDLARIRARVFHGYFQSWRYFHEIKDEITADFALIHESQNYLDHIAALPQDFTAIHIRRGGSGASILTENYHGLLDADYYSRAISLNELLGGSTNYIVFTDNPDLASLTLKELGLKPLKIVGPQDTSSQIENLHIMAHATSFIGANSSYSWWAAYLAKNLKTPPIFPRQWYMDPNISNNDMLPPDWISIGFTKFQNEENYRGINV